jgi:hypothetical protein
VIHKLSNGGVVILKILQDDDIARHERFPSESVVLAHHFVQPRHEFLDVGVDTRQMLTTTTNAPRDQSDECLSAVHRYS